MNRVILSPIEVAIDTMSKMNQELQSLILRFSAPDPENSLNPLTMRLNGVIDAAVNGGIAKYQEVSSYTMANTQVIIVCSYSTCIFDLVYLNLYAGYMFSLN